MALTILKECNNNFDAELIKGALASEGIPCIIQGENINRLYGGISAFPIKVLVNEEDKEAAMAIVTENVNDNDNEGKDE